LPRVFALNFSLTILEYYRFKTVCKSGI